MTDDEAERAADVRRSVERDDPDSIDLDEVSSLLDAADAEARADAAETAARLSTGSTERVLSLVPRLAELLGDESPTVRANAAMTLAAVAKTHPDRVDECTEALAARLGDENEQVRASAALALTNVASDSPASVATLLDAADVESLLTDESRDVRSNGVELVVELAGRGFENVLDEAVRERLVDSLDDDAWFVRERACVALGVLGDERDRKWLQRRAESDTNDLVRDTAETALQRLEERH
jgi:HEAT repeat protein